MLIDPEKKVATTPTSISADNEDGRGLSLDETSGDIQTVEIDKAVERSYLRKLDFYLLPYLSLMYLFNSVDRSNLANAKTDGFDRDMHFTGNEYSLLLLLFYIPNGLADLPLNLLTKRFSGKITLPSLMLIWGGLSMIQTGCTNFGGMLAVRLLIGFFEAGFFAGTVFYLTLFYNRNELGFRIALYFGSAVLAAAFSGILAYGVFQINDTSIAGWQYLFIIEGGITVLLSLFGYYWLPSSPQNARWFTPAEKEVARTRALRDGSKVVDEKFNFNLAFQQWKDPKMILWSFISLTYPIPFTTSANFLPQIVQRLGYSEVKTNLMTVPPNLVGFCVLLVVTWSSDHFRERTFHICFALLLSLIALIILSTIDVATHKGVAYFAMFLLASGAYIPSCLVHSWHNNNNLSENARAATTGILVGLGNLGGILSSATFRVEYAPKYIPTLAATAASAAACIILTLGFGLWMKWDNYRKNREQGVQLRAEDVDTHLLEDGEKSPNWRWFT
ncbi:hypothetical protein DTO166G4_4023 [Paecilomyces variotii]|nr:hypothetical protein DTO032I3_5862 [Paecilomyces variotii]KAJ9205314.1 hypothetical protein DTO164E3_1292 [Paecilomyces variotii]KAJ9214399.1 hypothetical protein DTO166G4_4023 [Paecilomyces variotii]KAJ9234836.1 hypothetical protein DTO166G5_4921 [Paecilomyces variotii]KAJ9266195.1 hypothetical protein DTO195F2_1310 [Paecilomyces variotii]